MGLLPGVLRLQVLPAGAWNKWWHTHHQRGDLPSPPPPTPEQAMIASLQRYIASLEGVINTLRCEPAESRGEPATARPR